MGKAKTLEELERFKKLEESGKAYRFSKENQPSKERQVQGMKDYWAYRHTAQRIVESLTEMPMPDGSKANFWVNSARVIFAEILGKDSTLKPSQKLHFITKLYSLLPKEDKLFVETSEKNPFEKMTIDELVEVNKELDQKIEELIKRSGNGQ